MMYEFENKNIALEIIDEVIQEKSTESQGFIIDSDDKAEWALRKIAEEKAETQKYINVCRAMILEYEEKIREKDGNLKNKLSFLEEQLRCYFESVPKKATKTQQTYKLPSGTLKLKYQQPEFVRNDEQLVKWLKENKMNDFIKREEKANWAELKKNLVVTGEQALTEDGQIIEGVQVIGREPLFEIDI